MNRFLVFQLYSPLVSWGEIAVGEVRGSADRPTKSAVLGLLCAALGVRRNDEARQAAVTRGFGFGLKRLRMGQPLRDYHTIQVPRASRNTSYATRRDELNDVPRLGTILSTRDYRCESLHLAAVWRRADAPYRLIELRDALYNPVFQVYLGRKSCPPAVPFRAEVIEAGGLREALDTFKPDSLLIERLPGRDGAEYFWEGTQPGLDPQQSHIRHDQVWNRRRWQFEPRTEHSRRG